MEENEGYKIDWKGGKEEDLVVFGTGNESFLVYDPTTNKYQHRDEMLSNILESYDSFEELFLGVVKDESIL